jgi:hypothetical protein
MEQLHRQVAAALSAYFDGLYESDTRKLAAIFHPEAIYACATDGRLLRLGMADYFPMVDRRPSPQSRGERRTDRIVSIQLAGPVTAFVHAECSIGAKQFSDFLTLVFVDGRWQIISKVFHYELSETAAAQPPAR